MKAPVPNGGQRWVPVLRIIQPGYFSLSDHSPGMDPARLKDNPAAGIRHRHWAHFLYAAYHRARDNKGPESIRFSAFKLLDAMKVQLKGAPGEQVLVQVWDGDGNGDREMSNISETLDKCPRTKDTCQLSAC